MAAHHFFVGLGAGVAMLSLPLLASGAGPAGLVRGLGQWIDGPAPAVTTQKPAVADPDALRPRRGFLPGDPTPAPTDAPLPSLQPATLPTPRPTPAPPPVSMSSVRTGVVHTGGAGVYVRRAAGVTNTGDPFLPDGSPVIASTGATIRVGGDEWQSIRALHNIVGWVPRAWVQLDGDQVSAVPPAVISYGPLAAPQSQGVPAAQSSTSQTQLNSSAAAAGISVAGVQAPQAAASRARVANTDGEGVVLRNSPNPADRRPAGLMEGATVTVLEVAGANQDWARVRDDRGQEGWVPAQYLAPAN